MSVELTIHGTLPSVLSCALIQRAVQRSLQSVRRSKAVIGVVFVTEVKMRKLNQQYRRKLTATDVLSFSYQDPKKLKSGLEGDLFICSSYVKKQATKQGISFREELLRMLVHGVLHLAGFTHETDINEKRMFLRQERIVQSL